MKKVLVFNGSIRKTGNTAHLTAHFLDACRENTDQIEVIDAHELNLEYCTGCLRGNILKRCSISGDDWPDLSQKILGADILVFASPIYFHHVSAQLKKIIDRFRSFVHVQITEKGLIHTPHQDWKKDFVLLLTMGNPDVKDAQPVIDLFKYMTEILGNENKLHVITGTRLAVTNHVIKSKEELLTLYSRMKLPLDLVDGDYANNRDLLNQCKDLARSLT